MPINPSVMSLFFIKMFTRNISTSSMYLLHAKGTFQTLTAGLDLNITGDTDISHVAKSEIEYVLETILCDVILIVNNIHFIYLIKDGEYHSTF